MPECCGLYGGCFRTDIKIPILMPLETVANFGSNHDLGNTSLCREYIFNPGSFSIGHVSLPEGNNTKNGGLEDVVPFPKMELGASMLVFRGVAVTFHDRNQVLGP